KPSPAPGRGAPPSAVRAQDPHLARFVLCFRQYAELSQAMVLAHFISQELGLLLRSRRLRGIDVLDELDEEELAAARAADPSGHAHERCVAVHAAKLQRLRRAAKKQQEGSDADEQRDEGGNESRAVPRR